MFNLLRGGIMGKAMKLSLLLLSVAIFYSVSCFGGITSRYVRRLEASIDMPIDSDVFKVPSGYNAPQQVHITQGDHIGRAVIVSWVTAAEPGSSTVLYGTEKYKYKYAAHGIATTYKFYNYTSGYIHHCRVKHLQYNTKYFYRIGIGNTTRDFSFSTPPRIGPDTPYTFGIIGDLGQSFDSNKTFQHYSKTKGQTILYVGDLSYADTYPFHDNVRWDTWGRFIERSTAYQPWIWTAGNHEIDFVPELGEIKPFKPYLHRYHVPYRSSNSTAPFWYSIKRASTYIIVLSSYSAYGKYTPQYRWLEQEFPKVDRKETPWLIVLMHAPWYNSNYYHYMEGESMRVQFEPWFTEYKVDIVFAGHVHAYERSYDTEYFYKIGIGNTTREFSFSTPPKVGPDTPYTFGVIGDLGQTFDSFKTFQHYQKTKGQTVLYVGDLSYADDYPFHDNVRWDTWGRFVEKSVAYQPWIWTVGNHEIDFAPEIGEKKPFKPYSHRYHVPYRSSNSTNPLWYSIKRASAYIIILSSYSAYGKYTPQYQWLEEELPKVDRQETPWLIVLMHVPWYNSNNYHYMEGETMRVQFESWFTKYKVDVVFAGHVHAYERSKRISNVAYNIVNGNCTPVPNPSAPVYITIGDGGNQEGLAANFTEPQPAYSIMREASFGHALLEIKNRTHAYYSWHRNQDGDDVIADSQWFYNRYWYPHDEPVIEQ